MIMSPNNRKNIALLSATAFLFLALFDAWQYGFFTILRFVVFTACAYSAWLAYENDRESWGWFMGAIAVLFNPFISIHFQRDVWVVIDSVIAIVLILSVFLLKLPKTH